MVRQVTGPRVSVAAFFCCVVVLHTAHCSQTDYCSNQASALKNSSDMRSNYEHIKFHTKRPGHSELSETMTVSYDGGLYVGGQKMISHAEHELALQHLRNEFQPPACVSPGGKSLQYNGSRWFCVCEDGYHGVSCNVYLPPALGIYTFDSDLVPGADSSGNNNTASLQNFASRTNDGTLLIENAGDHLLIPQPAWLGDNEQWTLSCWLRPKPEFWWSGSVAMLYHEGRTDNGVHKHTLVARILDGESAETAYFRSIYDSFPPGGGTTAQAAATFDTRRVNSLFNSINNSSWIHLTWTKVLHPTPTVYLYVSGEYAASQAFEEYHSGAEPYNPQKGVIGGTHTNHGQLFYGEVDDLHIYAHELSAKQIKHIKDSSI